MGLVKKELIAEDKEKLKRRLGAVEVAVQRDFEEILQTLKSIDLN